ncbi:helix-turn-helix domain-containing protein [Alteromonadaceae bacterium BrNp21-10]|nr:helix-turn-helix domain-containing protein [Alteromonadaceae bacterium BrNp21-10]
MRVAILTYDQAAFFELGCAVELFALPRPEFSNWYQTEVVTFDSQPLSFNGGIMLQAKVIQSLAAYDMLVIPSWPVNAADISDALAQQLRQFYQQQKRILTFCSGAFLLAHSGLLSGRQATTHWRYADAFKQYFNDVEYVDNVLYLYDGIIGHSAGSAAAIDLGIEVIRQDHGYHIANKVARRLVVSAHRKGGQSQFVDLPVDRHQQHFSLSLDWAKKNLHNNIDINQFASQANMSRRSFDRKFRSALNLTPKEWLTNQKLELAKQQLESSLQSIEKIASVVGFDNATTMRHHFRKSVGVSPKQYREQFRA